MPRASASAVPDREGRRRRHAPPRRAGTSTTSTAFTSISSALGSPWMPPSTATVAQLEALGRATLDGLAKQYGFGRHTEQVEENPADVIVTRASSTNAEIIVMGSRGRSGLSRLVLGSTAEKVIRASETSVLVVR